MSVKLKKSEKWESGWGVLEVVSNEDHLSEEEYVGRMRALIDLLQLQDEDTYHQESFFHVLEMLSDMLPTAEQARKMFNTAH